MTKFDKLYAQIVNNPRDVKFEDLDKLLMRYGFERRQPRRGSSHYNYSHPDLAEVITIPFNRPVKAVYVIQAIEALRKLERSEYSE
ncbi:type II toxin-antitoxin system HicA family toxin [Paradesulfitobacterium ferrireducens]|uniref:type II toxin-antitoxin system HicA family toxin n=1 Tax=Paradesulfitobacterium ferrireducens TaxID=2816476 RepID=UPI001A8F9096|nr:type II toxin-antitoxin system HicA family toxin [Paradesulfitobacterium ferrireducens]